MDPAEERRPLEELDRAWEAEREAYLVKGRSGARYVPSAGLSVLAGGLTVGFGLAWAAAAFLLTGGVGAYPLFGLLFIVLGVWVGVASFRKALRYRRAEADYRRRRADLLSGAAGPRREGRCP